MAETQGEPGSDHLNRQRRPARRWVPAILLVLLLLVVAGEIVSRFYLGLGDPPLSVADPQVEYLFKPSQDVQRFGNRVLYNAYSMRSEDFPANKNDPHELRIMVIGDSVVNGGALTDHSDLATTLLQNQLRERLDRPVIVGNISAGSWGPPNMLGYARKFGLFDADIVVIVLSSHDYADVPTEPFTPTVGVRPEFPHRKPVLALEELIMRYLLPRLRASADASLPPVHEPKQIEVARGLSALRELIELSHSRGAKVIVAQYLDPDEAAGQPPKPGHAMIKTVAEQAAADVIQLGPAQQSSLRAGVSPFRDTIHPNVAGQRVMADVLLEPIIERCSE